MGQQNWVDRARAWRRRCEFLVFRVAYLVFCEDTSDSYDKKALVVLESLQFAVFPLFSLLSGAGVWKGSTGNWLFGFAFTNSFGVYKAGVPLCVLCAFALHCFKLYEHFRHGVPVEDSWLLIYSFRVVWRTLKPLFVVAVLEQSFASVAVCLRAGAAETLSGFGIVVCGVEVAVCALTVAALLVLTTVDYSPSVAGPSGRNRAWSGSLLQEAARLLFVLLSVAHEMRDASRELAALATLAALAAHEYVYLSEPSLWLSQTRLTSYCVGLAAVLLSGLRSFDIVAASSVPVGVALLAPPLAYAAFAAARRRHAALCAASSPETTAAWALEVPVATRQLSEGQEVEQVEGTFAAALARFPESQLLRVAFAEFLLWSKDPSTLIQHLCKLSTASLWFPYRYRMYSINRRRIEAIEQMLGESSLTFQEEFKLAKSVHIEALARIRSFWEILLRNDLDPHLLARVSESVGHSRRRGDAKYRRLLGRFRSRRLMAAYARFLSRVSWELDLAERYQREAEEQAKPEGAPDEPDELFPGPAPAPSLPKEPTGTAVAPAAAPEGPARAARATMRGKSVGSGKARAYFGESDSGAASAAGAAAGPGPRAGAASAGPGRLHGILKARSGGLKSAHSSHGISARALSAIGLGSEEDSFSETLNQTAAMSAEAAKQQDLRVRVKRASNSAAVDALARRTLAVLLLGVLLGAGYYASVRSLVENTRAVVGVLGSSVERTRLSQEAPLLARSLAAARARGDRPAAAAAQAALKAAAKRLHGLHKQLYTDGMMSARQLREVMEQPLVRTRDALADDGAAATLSLWEFGNRYVRKALDVAEYNGTGPLPAHHYAFLVENAEAALASFSNATRVYCESNVSAGRLRLALQLLFAAVLLAIVFSVKEYLIAPVLRGLDRERKLAVSVFGAIPKGNMAHLIEGIRKEELALIEEATEYEEALGLQLAGPRHSVGALSGLADSSFGIASLAPPSSASGPSCLGNGAIMAAAQSAANHARTEARDGARRHSPTAVSLESHMYRRVFFGLLLVALALLLMLAHAFWLVGHGLGIANEIAASGQRGVLVRSLHLSAVHLATAPDEAARAESRAKILAHALVLEATHQALVFGSAAAGIAVGHTLHIGQASSRRYDAMEALMYSSPATDADAWRRHFNASGPAAHLANKTGDYRTAYCLEFSLSRFVDEARALARESSGALSEGNEHLAHLAEADGGLLSQQLDLAIARFSGESLAHLQRGMRQQESLLLASFLSIALVFLAVFLPILNELREEGDLTLSMLCMVPGEELDKIEAVRAFLEEKQGGGGAGAGAGPEGFERLLEASRQETRSIMEAVYVGIAVFDTAGEIALVNHATERAFGYKRSELVGRPASLLIGPALHGALVLGSREVVGQQLEITAERSGGEKFPCTVAITDVASA
eukprot:tig00001250_g7801.t1